MAPSLTDHSKVDALNRSVCDNALLKSRRTTGHFQSQDDSRNMTMEQLLEFTGNHLLLSAAVVVVIFLLIGNELLRLIKGEKRLSPADAVRIINDQEAVVLDMRSLSDYKKGHIINARQVSMTKIEEVGKELSKKKSAPVLCYCALGSTAPQACEKLKKMGFEQVYSLRGGLNAWQAASLPVTTR